jgi:membrane-bound lytic murein transglycosylase A
MGIAYVADAAGVDPLNIPDTQLEPVEWAALDGWRADDHVAAFATFLASCKPFLAIDQPRDPRPIYDGLLHACRRAAAIKIDGTAEARTFFEENFRPVRIARLGKSTGLLTGYYEPIVDGSRFPDPEFHWPLYRRPRDLLVNGRKPVGAGFPNRAAVGHINPKGQVEPYYDRRAIENGALDGQHLEICWLRDPLQAMSIEIEGSARVRLEDGTLLRLNYDAHNGFPRTAVEGMLFHRSLIPREKTSMDRIEHWMDAYPEEANNILATNRSVVFFRITGLNNEDEPAGAQGVPLHPGRSIAVDRTHVFGTPFFIEADLPIAAGRPTEFRRLMIAQDTGSAMVGPARADIYWGAGDEAGRIAGRTWQQGRFVILLPRELDMVAAGKVMPLPRPKPPIPNETVASTGKGSQVQGHEKDRATQTTPAEKASVAKITTVEDYKKLLISLRQQAQPNARTNPHSYGIVVNKWVEDRAQGYQKDRAKPKAEKRGPETVGRAQKPEYHKNQLINSRQRSQPASKNSANPRS